MAGLQTSLPAYGLSLSSTRGVLQRTNQKLGDTPRSVRRTGAKRPQPKPPPGQRQQMAHFEPSCVGDPHHPHRVLLVELSSRGRRGPPAVPLPSKTTRPIAWWRTSTLHPHGHVLPGTVPLPYGTTELSGPVDRFSRWGPDRNVLGRSRRCRCFTRLPCREACKRSSEHQKTTASTKPLLQLTAF
jgi:hypothetical protein